MTNTLENKNEDSVVPYSAAFYAANLLWNK